MVARVRITKWDPEPFLRGVNQQLAARMETAAGIVEADVKGSMAGGGRPHVPSQPGEPPRIDSGNLRRNISHSVVVQGRTVRGFVIANTNYARFLELGTRLMEARPFLRPALARNRARIVQVLGARFGGGLR